MKDREFPILDIENFQFKNLLKISMLSHQEHGVNLISAHKHDFFLFFLIEQGSGLHTIDFVDYNVGSRELHILLPEQVHEWSLSDQTKGFQLMISKEIFNTFTNYFDFSPLIHFKHPVILLSDEKFNILKNQFLFLESELDKNNLTKDIIYTATNLITQIISRYINDEFEDFTQLKNHSLLARYITLIDDYYKENKTVLFYANLLHVTPNYLNILCKKYTSLTANTMIKNRIVLEAKRLLQISTLSVKEIAYELGFNDFSNFSTFFKAHTGLSPRDFKSKL